MKPKQVGHLCTSDSTEEKALWLLYKRYHSLCTNLAQWACSKLTYAPLEIGNPNKQLLHHAVMESLCHLMVCQM